jgi:hypothetical protein
MDLIEFSGSKFNRHPWELCRSKIFAKKYSKIFNNSNSLIKILDFGCGDAWLSHNIVKQISSRTQLVAFDPYLKEIDLFEDSKIRVTNAISDEKFDCIFLFDVLEHIELDVDFMINLRNSLSHQETHILISVPAMNYLFSEHDIYLKHYRRYNVQNLSRVLKESGFNVNEIHYFFLLPLIIRFVKTKIIKGKYQHDSPEVANWRFGKFITSAVTNILFLDYFFCKLFTYKYLRIPGLSIFVHATIK